jgi:hypothetical protein
MVRQTKRLIRAPASSSKTWQRGDGSVSRKRPRSWNSADTPGPAVSTADTTNHDVMLGIRDAEGRDGGEAHAARR